MQFSKIGLLSGLLLMMLFGCQPATDLSIDKSQMELAFPLFHAEMSIAEMLKNSKDSSAVIVYPDSSISLVYRGELVKRNTEDILGTIPPDKIPILAQVMNVPLSVLDGVQINEAFVKQGFLHYRFTLDTTSTDVTVTLTLPQLLDNGAPFSTTVIVPAVSGGVPSVVQDSIDLTGYNLSVTTQVLTLQYTATDGYGNNITLPIDTDLINPTKNFMYLTDVYFSYVEGHWDPVVHDFEAQTIEIDFFENNFVNGEVYFDNPRIDFNVINSFGQPVRTKVNYFRIIELDSNVVDLQSSLLTDGVDFNYPSLNEVGQAKLTHYYFDKTNSNVGQILNTNPVRVEYDIDVIINPDSLPDFVGFATDSSYFSLDARAELPLVGKVGHFIVEKEFDMSPDIENVESAVLKMSSDNEVPLQIAVQLYFIDDAGGVIDSLVEGPEKVIIGAADYPLSQPNHVETEFIIPPDKWSRIKKAKKIKVRSNYTTSQNGQQIVTFRANQKTHLKVGLKVGL